MGRELTETRIMQALANHPALQEAVIAESALMELLTCAASEPDARRRWRRYEELKRVGSGYVGWQARQPALQSSAVYEAFVSALDELLPLEETA